MLRVFKTPRVHVSVCAKKTAIFLLLGFAIPRVRTECLKTRQQELCFPPEHDGTLRCYD